MEQYGDQLEKSGSKVSQLNQRHRRSSDTKFKLMVINAAGIYHNCHAAKIYSVNEYNVRRGKSTGRECEKQSEEIVPRLSKWFTDLERQGMTIDRET